MSGQLSGHPGSVGRGWPRAARLESEPGGCAGNRTVVMTTPPQRRGAGKRGECVKSPTLACRAGPPGPGRRHGSAGKGCGLRRGAPAPRTPPGPAGRRAATLTPARSNRLRRRRRRRPVGKLARRGARSGFPESFPGPRARFPVEFVREGRRGPAVQAPGARRWGVRRGGCGSACGEGTGRRGPGLSDAGGRRGGAHAGPGPRRGGACECRRGAAAARSGPPPRSLGFLPSPQVLPGEPPSAAGRGSWALWGRPGRPARPRPAGRTPGQTPGPPGRLADAARGLPADRRREAGRAGPPAAAAWGPGWWAVPGSRPPALASPVSPGRCPPSWEARSVPGNCPNTRRCELVKQAPETGFKFYRTPAVHFKHRLD